MSVENNFRQYNSIEVLEHFNARDKIFQFIDLLWGYNKKVNLVSRETSKEDITRISAECLIPFHRSDAPAGKYFDIGSGGGFPAIIKLLAFPKIKATLFERTQKKCRFLSEAIEAFDLDAKVIPLNFLEYTSRLSVSSFDTASMRLVRPEKPLFKEIAKLLKQRGQFVYYGPLSLVEFEFDNLFTSSQTNYYIDGSQQVRSFSILSNK